MIQTQTIFETPKASQYLQQLCKHFGHKVPVTFTETEGQITLPFGACQLTADATQLVIAAEGAAGKIDRLEGLIADHLARFAFRETPNLTWQRTA